MKTIDSNVKYMKWLSGEEMHLTSKNWLSDLQFKKDEHLFFNDLIRKIDLKNLETGVSFDKIQIIDAINRSEKRNNLLIGMVKLHKGQLIILLDGKDEIDSEKVYKEQHKSLMSAVNHFSKNYNLLKKQLVDIFKIAKKDEKIRCLISKRDSLQ
jgi:hypothetical protein